MINNKTENNKRVAKNTLLLYFRMFITMAVSLYTSRIVLNTLGVDDFGIYNVVGGVVAMFSLLSGSLSASVSRFLTFELGKGNTNQLRKIFSTSIVIHVALALVVLILAESIGIWFLNTKMNIPESRIVAANWVMQFSIFTFVVNIISVPYNATIIAHEHMKAFAYISIVEVLLKLAVVYLLYVLLFDKLIIYSLMIFAVALIIRIIYGIYCKSNFEECKLKFSFDKQILKEMTGFAGWNFIGASAGVMRNEGVNVALNLFCGPAVNAARGISFQVSAAINAFVTNFMTALNPQITKSYASGDHKYSLTLVYQGARLSFYMLLLLSLPIIFEAEQVLTIWLKIVPAHTVNFVRLVLLFTLTETLSRTMITAMLATGNIRNYQIIVGGLQLMNFPFSYLLLKIGLLPEITMIVSIVISICCLIARLVMLKGMIDISIRYFARNVMGNVLVVSILSSIIPYLVYRNLSPNIGRLIIVSIVSVVNTLSVIFFIGCSQKERKLVYSKIENFKSKSFRKSIVS